MSEVKQSIEMPARIISGASKELVNETTGSKSHLFSAEILEGPLAGKKVTAKRTVLNSEGVVKENCAKGDSVTLHYSTFEGKDGKRYASFQISSAVVTADNDDLLSIMDKQEVAQAGE